MVDNKIMNACRTLVQQGWLPLGQLSYLLGHSHSTGIYARQGGPNHIPTVRVGRTHRVHFDDVIHALKNPIRTARPEDTRVILTIIARMMNEQEQGDYYE